ncbi:hypothetical protein [Limnoglobus roseus]|uniref:Uncharacterized protein n=1 Tax=Limnoglobus roseus TaxID=2598579 RepID=A0A5C1AN70_9BACT|nr:hypothetical protein [Limnoglobus roseus]QEL19563.1 hypothetical protein PX52LOC_06639 [Limnoglobus roseus]
MAGFAQPVAGFTTAGQQMAQAFNVFAGNATALATALSAMPRTLTGQFQHHVTVTFNGAEVLSKLSPEIKSMVTAQVRKSLGQVFKEQMPDAGVKV